MKRLIVEAVARAGSAELFAITNALEEIALERSERGGRRSLVSAYNYLAVHGIKTTGDVLRTLEELKSC